MSGALLLAVGAVSLLWLVAGVVLARTPGRRLGGVSSAATGLLGLAAGATGWDLLVLTAVLGAGPLTLVLCPADLRRDRVTAAAAGVVVVGSVVVVASPGASLAEPVAWTALPLAVIGSLWWRLEEADGPASRRPLLWSAFGLLLCGALLFVAGFMLGQEGSVLLGTLALAVPAVTLVIGLRRPDVVDTRGLLVSAVVTGTAVVTVLGGYVTIASLVELALGRPPTVGWQGVIAAVVATGFPRLRRELHGMVDRLLFGGRPDPVSAAFRVSGEVGDDPQAAVAAIREGLVLPYVALQRRPRGGEPAVVAEAGDATPYVRELVVPAVLPGEDLSLVVGLRAGDLRLSSADLDVLRLTLPLLALTVRAQSLSAGLQESRARTRTAVEEERRRLRRDLHDGLGPRLSGVAFTLDAARNLVGDDPEAARAMLGGVRSEAGAALEDLRRVVYGMRPPALDELGLVGALRQHADGLALGARRLLVSLEVPDDLSTLPAAVEVAAYRIAVEALTNVARHTASPSASVLVRRESGVLVVEVRDVAPVAGEWTPGVGLGSMRERALEIGGTFAAGPSDQGGRVRAELPVDPVAISQA